MAEIVIRISQDMLTSVAVCISCAYMARKTDDMDARHYYMETLVMTMLQHHPVALAYGIQANRLTSATKLHHTIYDDPSILERIAQSTIVAGTVYLTGRQVLF